MAVTNKLSRRERIKFSIRKKFSGTTGRPRLTVFRSNSEIYAQIIDDTTQKTVVSVSSLKEKGTKTEKAKAWCSYRWKSKRSKHYISGF